VMLLNSGCMPDNYSGTLTLLLNGGGDGIRSIAEPFRDIIFLLGKARTLPR
jgi:hypothetical protein